MFAEFCKEYRPIKEEKRKADAFSLLTEAMFLEVFGVYELLVVAEN